MMLLTILVGLEMPLFQLQYVDPDTDMRFMIENTRDDNVVTSILTIESVLSSDNGTEYFCFATFIDRSFNGIISVAGDYVQYISYSYYTVFAYMYKICLSKKIRMYVHTFISYMCMQAWL